jgi:hypothetical protein
LRHPIGLTLAPFRSDVGPDLRLGLRPDAPTCLKAFNQPTVLHGKEAKPIGRKPGLGQEVLDFGKDVLSHAARFARLSVYVNARHNVQTALFARDKIAAL